MRTLILSLAFSAAFTAASPAYAVSAYLMSTWFDGGNQMCKYSDGTVLNVGSRICPLRIGD